eukprot:scaffold279_cov229-Pinguiococcus_pyrenoidosus.AAC.33
MLAYSEKRAIAAAGVYIRHSCQKLDPWVMAIRHDDVTSNFRFGIWGHGTLPDLSMPITGRIPSHHWPVGPLGLSNSLESQRIGVDGIDRRSPLIGWRAARRRHSRKKPSFGAESARPTRPLSALDWRALRTRTVCGEPATRRALSQASSERHGASSAASDRVVSQLAVGGRAGLLCDGRAVAVRHQVRVLLGRPTGGGGQHALPAPESHVQHAGLQSSENEPEHHRTRRAKH